MQRKQLLGHLLQIIYRKLISLAGSPKAQLSKENLVALFKIHYLELNKIQDSIPYNSVYLCSQEVL